jgi:hypothetical protein
VGILRKLWAKLRLRRKREIARAARRPSDDLTNAIDKVVAANQRLIDVAKEAQSKLGAKR